MKRILLLGLFLTTGPLWGAEPPLAPATVEFPLDMAIVDPESKEKLPPYIVMFDDGKDENGKDVTGPLGRLEALRGASKMFPDSNKNAGLPVVLRGLRFHRRMDGAGKLAGYDLELLGEFNAVKVPVAVEDMKKFLTGESVTFTLRAEKNFGLYSYVSTMKMAVQLVGKEIRIDSIAGDFCFREGFYTYTAKSKKLTPPAGRKFLFRGENVELPVLPTI